MKKRFAALNEAVRKTGDVEAKLSRIKNVFAGERCFVLTCGPSLQEQSAEELRIKLANEAVFAVKQAYNLFPDIIDVHLLNSWNWQGYTYPAAHRPLVFMERLEDDPPTPGLQADFVFGLKYPHDKSRQLALTHDFEDFTFENGVERPWGPGIMYEFGFYLPMYMGFKEIIVLGWDLGMLNSNKMDHFFDQQQSGRLGYAQEENQLSNKPRIIPEEVKRIADSTGDMYRWLCSKGVQLRIISDRSLIDPCVPRIRLGGI